MPVTGSITTRFIDEKGLDLGKTLIEKDYLISVYPNILNQFDTPMLMTCGFNTYGGLGDNTVVKKSSPIQTIAYGANWKQVSSGYDFCAGIKTDGTLWTWGSNSENGRTFATGQIGDNTTTDKSSPVQTVTFGTNWKQVACGWMHTMAVKTDGTLWGWGYAGTGCLGDNTTSSKSSPVQTIAGGTNWKQVSAGRLHTAAVKTDGTLWTWGYNASGQLGDNSVTQRNSPVQTVAFGTNWIQVTAGYQSTAGIKADGTLWTWGMNTSGQLGDNTTVSRSSPVQTVAFGTNWARIQPFTGQHMFATKTNGTLWGWGQGTSGQLGENIASSNRSSPVQTVTFATNWKFAAGGLIHTAAIKTDGTLWFWGSNDNGQYGNNTVTGGASPVQSMLYGTTWKSISCGRSTMFAIKDGDF